MNIFADIVSGDSIGDIKIGSDLQTVLAELFKQNHKVEKKSFKQFDVDYSLVNVDSGMLSIVADSSNSIVRLWCRQPYRGKFRGIFFPGMPVSEILDKSKKQLIIHGMLILDDDFGVGFNIPDKYNGSYYDDVDYVDQMPQNMVLEELHVMKKEWWR